MFSGLFEVHITVQISDNNFITLLDFASKYKQKKGMKVVFAASTVGNNQYMVSYFTFQHSEQFAIEKANQFKQELEKDFGIHVLRVKVEGHSATNIPQTTEVYQQAKAYIATHYPNSNKPYFEFHAKVSNVEQFGYSKLNDFMKLFDGSVAMSINLCSASKKPLITIRKYEVGYQEAKEYKDAVLEQLKKEGLLFEPKLQEEFSVYDDYPQIDKGWLVVK